MSAEADHVNCYLGSGAYNIFTQSYLKGIWYYIASHKSQYILSLLSFFPLSLFPCLSSFCCRSMTSAGHSLMAGPCAICSTTTSQASCRWISLPMRPLSPRRPWWARVHHQQGHSQPMRRSGQVSGLPTSVQVSTGSFSATMCPPLGDLATVIASHDVTVISIQASSFALQINLQQINFIVAFHVRIFQLPTNF